MEYRLIGQGGLRVSAIGLGCIPGTKRVDRLEENAGAIQVKLDADDLRRIEEVMPPGVGAGSRYPAPQMKGVYI
jgi:aryl-alcohol dehydrogenase-like predicted oxidoreductase